MIASSLTDAIGAQLHDNDVSRHDADQKEHRK